jgi:uncharacterized protein (TIGR02284 family)
MSVFRPFIKTSAVRRPIVSELDDHLVELHTAAIDARNGYQEAVEKSDGRGLSSLFESLTKLHAKHAAELNELLVQRGRSSDKDGSFMSIVHEAIIDFRSLIGGLDKSVLPGLIDGEKRNLAKYDEVLKEPVENDPEKLLNRQRGELASVIDQMSAMKAASS